jgi:molecular chaperone GrpE
MTEEIENQESAAASAPEDLGEAASESLNPSEPVGGVEELTRERDELKDLLLRKQAEFENFRKRTERERSDFVQYASAEVMRELLNVLDSFELALKPDGTDEEEGRKGFELIYKQLLDSLVRSGLEVIEVEGAMFDPNVHEAVSTQPAPEGVADGMVMAELRRGYQLRGKLLRPTMVMVASSDDSAGNI